jgi:hypothetical protein
MFVPENLCYVVTLALRAFQASAPRIRDDAKQVLAAAENATVRHHQAQNLVTAAAQSCAAETPPVLSPAQPLSSSEPKITVTDAAVLLDRTEQRIRRLARDRVITGRKIGRNVWELDRDSVIAYGEHRRRGRGDGSGKAPRRDEGPEGRQPHGGTVTA